MHEILPNSEDILQSYLWNFMFLNIFILLQINGRWNHNFLIEYNVAFFNKIFLLFQNQTLSLRAIIVTRTLLSPFPLVYMSLFHNVMKLHLQLRLCKGFNFLEYANLKKLDLNYYLEILLMYEYKHKFFMKFLSYLWPTDL